MCVVACDLGAGRIGTHVGPYAPHKLHVMYEYVARPQPDDKIDEPRVDPKREIGTDHTKIMRTYFVFRCYRYHMATSTR